MRAVDDVKLAAKLWLSRAAIWGYGHRGDLGAHLIHPGQQDDPYAAYEEIRRYGPIYRSKLGFAATSHHEVVSALLRDPRASVVIDTQNAGPAQVVLPPDRPDPIEDSLLGMDPPDHTRLRRLVSPWFTPRALRDRADRLTAVAESLLSTVDTGRPFDLMAEFAVPFPIMVICDLLAVPDPEVGRFARWGAIAGGSLGGVQSVRQASELRQTLADLDVFFTDLIAWRRRHPGDDLVSVLAVDAPGREPLTSRELIATCGLLLLAGFETTVNMIGNGTLALLAHPEQRAEFLRRPELAASLVEEILRYDSPVQYTGRTLTGDVEIAGKRLRAGSFVVLLLAGANRDPAVFPDPGGFDLTRPNARDHLAFSGGIHYCLGAGLARLEGEIAFRTLFGRFPNLELAGRVVRRRGSIIRGALRLPVAPGPVAPTERVA